VFLFLLCLMECVRLEGSVVEEPFVQKRRYLPCVGNKEQGVVCGGDMKRTC
jgi:hypothetical protein